MGMLLFLPFKKFPNYRAGEKSGLTIRDVGFSKILKNIYNI